MTSAKNKRAQRSTSKLGAITIARRIIQVGALVLFAAPLLAVGLGLFGMGGSVEEINPTASSLPFFGSISSSSIGPIVLMDPYAMLQVVAATKDFAVGWLVAALPILLFYGIIRGRAFCGWVCPVNLLLELLDWVRSKLGSNVVEHAVPRHTKIVCAALLLIACAITGLLVFELFSPISAINKGILFGSLTGLIVLAAIVVAELFWARRIWCRALCPLGGFYEVLGKVGLVSVRMNYDTCTHCGICKDVCLCDSQILDGVLDGKESHVRAGDCMLCGACVDACPVKALTVGVAAPFSK